MGCWLRLRRGKKTYLCALQVATIALSLGRVQISRGVALGLLGGATFEPPVFLRARLAKPLRQKTGLTVFMPAQVHVQSGEPMVELVGWQGSGDLVGAAAANCFLVVHPEQTDLAAGDWVDVLPKPA